MQNTCVESIKRFCFERTLSPTFHHVHFNKQNCIYWPLKKKQMNISLYGNAGEKAFKKLLDARRM